MRRTHQLARFSIALLLALAMLAGVSRTPSQADGSNGAGLVIRYGDGRIVTAYVRFEEPAITGIELLQRAGIPITVASYGGLGLAVCAIGGEGCPAEDCFCRAKSQPAWFWHYYGLQPDGRWTLHAVGASSRLVRDGDVDGWSWTSGDSGLPSMTIEEIARAHGIERPSPSTPTPAPTLPSPPPISTPAVTGDATPSPRPSLTVTPLTSRAPPSPSPSPITPTPAVRPSPTLRPTLDTPTVPPPGVRPTATPSPPAPVSDIVASPQPTSPLLTRAPTEQLAPDGPPRTALLFLGLGATILLSVLLLRRWRGVR
ncbi:MAG: hypothetical protein RMH81_08170 [Thermomicrobium sp.]|nr:hypothetical protein [Thermomicrobium sp.]